MRAVGVCAESVPYRQKCKIATIGDKAKVMVQGNTVKDDIIRAAKSGDNVLLGLCKITKEGDIPYLRVGTALSSGKGLIDCILELTYILTEDLSVYVPYIGATGDVNIGNHFLTGRFIVRPGEAAAGLAGIVFLPGTLLTVPVAGTMEFDGTGVYFTNTNHRRFFSMASDSIISSATATTVAPITLWTGITNADELKANRTYIIKGCGLYTTDAVDTALITLKFGATTIGSITTPVGLIVNGAWYLEIFLTVRTIGVFGTISAFGRIDASTGSSYGVLESFILNTTIANDLTIICAWSAVGNSLKLTQCWLKVED
jgi:hypothetical protein